MAWTLRQQQTLGSVYIGGGTAESGDAGFSEATLAGSLLTAIGVGSAYLGVGGGTLCTMGAPISPGFTWQLANSSTGAMAANTCVNPIYFIPNAPAMATSVHTRMITSTSPTAGATGADCIIQEWTGGPTNPIVLSTQVTDSGSPSAYTATTPNLTLANPGALILVSAMFTGASAGTGYTQGDGSELGCAVQYNLNGGSGSIVTSFATGGSEHGLTWSATAVAFGVGPGAISYNFEDPSGNPLAYGTVTFRLNTDAVNSIGQQVSAGYTNSFTLDANGNLTGNLWANSQLTPTTTFYNVTAYTSLGQPVFYAQMTVS